jgi:DNA-binding NtrC family response regulator
VQDMLVREAQGESVVTPDGGSSDSAQASSSKAPAWELKAQELAETCIKSGVPLEAILDGVERTALSLLIRQERHVLRMARKAQISESTLRGKLKKHHLVLES